MQISSMGGQCILYCPESTECAHNVIQGINLCDFTVFRRLNVGYGRVIVWYLALAEWAEAMSVNLAAEMPFYQTHDYDLELQLKTCKNRISKLLDENKIEGDVKQNDYMSNNFDQWKACEYADEDTFATLSNIRETGTLKLYFMNIRSLNKYKGGLVASLSNLPPPFDVLVLKGIGWRYIEMAKNLSEATALSLLIQIQIIMEELEFSGGIIFKISLKLI